MTSHVNNPKSQPNWRLDINGKKIESEEEIAECFNDYFVDKIQKLKENIDPEYIGDPLAKLKKKHENNVCKFALKQVSPNKLTKILKKLKKKKSSGNDGLPQEHLISGKTNLVPALCQIFNKSIESGEFPAQWKEAIVSPVLKKGNPEMLENYRPVSCLPSASKLLEMVVYELSCGTIQ